MAAFTGKGIAVIVLCALLCPVAVPAQALEFQRVVAPFSVTDRDARQLPFPFLGGFNAPRPQFVDIDGDADLDLFVQEQNKSSAGPGVLMYFENTGSAQALHYEWRTDSFHDLDIGNWYKFIDVDGDGDFDLFAENGVAVLRYYRNEGTVTNPQFVSLTDSLREVEGAPIFFDAGSFPELVDFDCNGTIDLFIGRSAAGTISFYKNLGLDLAGTPQFELVTDRFQDISIIGETNTTTLDKSSEAATHGSNSLSLVDVDSDDDFDIFWGDLFEPGLVFLRNDGTCTDPNISITTRQYPPNDPLNSSGFNAPRFADIDNDSDLDLFVGVLGVAFANGSHFTDNFYFYKNNGRPESPQFVLQETRFIATLDVGSNSAPAFVDIDADGDLDVFIGNEASANDLTKAELAFYRNTGTPGAPELTFESSDFLELQLGTFYAPTFVDIDADNDPDLFVGRWDGKLSFIENTGTPQVFAFGAAQQNYRAEIAGKDSVIDVGNNCTPTFADIDNDGDYDLFMGEFLRTINFYENIGSATEPVFRFVTNSYADISQGLYIYPSFADVDADGAVDLLVGSDRDGIVLYRNMGSAGNAVFTPDSLPDIKAPPRATPHLVDFDSNGDLDLFSGSGKGGLLLFENTSFPTAITPDQPASTAPATFSLEQNFPNPFNPETRIRYKVERRGYVRIVVFNTLGQEIVTLVDEVTDPGRYGVTWRGRDKNGTIVSSGIYVYQIQVDKDMASRRMLFLK